MLFLNSELELGGMSRVLPQSWPGGDASSLKRAPFGRPYGVAAVNHAARAMRARKASANTAVLPRAYSPKGAAHPDRETGQGMKSLARVEGRGAPPGLSGQRPDQGPGAESVVTA